MARSSNVETTDAGSQESSFVKMVRDEKYPEPRTAKVHPDEVRNYQLGGWVVESVK